MSDLDRYEGKGKRYFDDNVFDDLDRVELYEEIDSLCGIERVAIKFTRYRKLFYFFIRNILNESIHNILNNF